jgi:hypothetical protein
MHKKLTPITELKALVLNTIHGAYPPYSFLISAVDNRFYTAGVVRSTLTGSNPYFQFYIIIYKIEKYTTINKLKASPRVYIVE